VLLPRLTDALGVTKDKHTVPRTLSYSDRGSPSPLASPTAGSLKAA